MQAKMWSQARGMDVVGVDDPETEQDIIREESTDAALWPERVQVMAQLLAALQQMGIQAPQSARAQAQGQVGSANEVLANALRGQAAPLGPGDGGPGGSEPGNTPPLAPPGTAQDQNMPFAQGPADQGTAMAQTMIQNGQAKSRILTQQKLNMGRRA